MKFLYGIKACSKCAKRNKCQEKNNPATMCSPRRIDYVNRGLKRSGTSVSTFETCCSKFELEGKPFAP